SADQVRGGAAAPGMLKAAANALAVNRHELTARTAGQRLRPSLEATFKGFRIQTREDALKSVLRGNAVGQIQKGLEPLELGPAEINHIRPGIRRTDHCTNGN